MHLDIQLALWRDLVEATTAGITLHIDNTQSVVRIPTDTLKTGEQTWFDLHLQLLRTLAQVLFLHTCLIHDLVQLILLLHEGLLTVGDQRLGICQVGCALLYTGVGLTDLLVAELNLQSLKLDLLAQRVVLTVVAHLVELLLIALHTGLSLFDISLALLDSLTEILYFCLDLLLTGEKTGNLVFQVLHLEWQFTPERSLLIDSRKG